MKPLVSLREALEDDRLLGRAIPGDSWMAWRTVLLSAMGEPLRPDELEIFRHLTDRTTAPSEPAEEVTAVVGRRGGKTRALALCSTYLATLIDYSEVLAPGERGIALMVGPDQRQAKIALGYASGFINQSPLLSERVIGRTADSISLNNGVDLEVRAASFRRLRGVTAVAGLLDEAAYLSTDEMGANPDYEIAASLRPALATTRGPLIIASSPYRKAGELWNNYTRHFGRDDDPVLVVKGETRIFNPSLSPQVIERALERDPVAARAEYLAEFRDDISGYVTQEAIRSCVDEGVRERPPVSHHRYFDFVDPAGGSGTDSMVTAVGHREENVIVVDALRERRPPFSPMEAVNEAGTLLKSYRINRITGDRWGGEFVREPFRQLFGIDYRLSELSKSEIYVESLPRLNAGTIRLLDIDRLRNQLAGLERTHGRTGRDIIDHPPRGNDDLANATMGLATMAAVDNRLIVGAYRGCY